MSNIQSSKPTAPLSERGLFPADASWDSFEKMFKNLRSHWPFQMLDPASTALTSKRMLLNPNVDIKESKTSYEIAADLPGLQANDISLEISGDVLTISGEKKTEEPSNEDKNYHVMERHYGFFKRSFTLPSSVVNDKISADFKDGVLHISLPKSEKALQQQRKITING